jgi:hypothetical protein
MDAGEAEQQGIVSSQRRESTARNPSPRARSESVRRRPSTARPTSLEAPSAARSGAAARSPGSPRDPPDARRARRAWTRVRRRARPHTSSRSGRRPSRRPRARPLLAPHLLTSQGLPPRCATKGLAAGPWAGSADRPGPPPRRFGWGSAGTVSKWAAEARPGPALPMREARRPPPLLPGIARPQRARPGRGSQETRASHPLHRAGPGLRLRRRRRAVGRGALPASARAGGAPAGASAGGRRRAGGVAKRQPARADAAAGRLGCASRGAARAGDCAAPATGCPHH